jgi:hypothetical protein
MDLPSTSPRAHAVSALLLLGWLLTAGCAQFAETPAPFPLEWRGVEASLRPPSLVAEGLRKHTLQIEKFVDHRPQPAKIGLVQQVNEVVRTSSDVGAFCTQRFGELLTGAGATVVTSGGTLTLKPELTVFEVIEGGMFNAEAVIRVSVIEGGKEIYAGTHTGKSKRWGRSRSPDNYNEALSNALFEATKKLLDDEPLGKALGGATPSSP